MKVVEGPALINRSMGKRRIVVGVNVQDRDLGGYVQELQQKVEHQVQLPAGYYIEWGGQFHNMQRAMHHLMVIVPITIAAIFFLLFILFHSVRFAALIITVLPLASIGGIVGLFVSGEYLSVPASVGFIALWGIAVLNGVVLVSYIRKLREEGLTQANAVREGTRLRFRPVMMTATVAALGLVPFLFATGPGSEIQRPLAIVVIGGLVSSTALTLLLLPVVYAAFEGKEAMPAPGARFVNPPPLTTSRLAANRSRPRNANAGSSLTRRSRVLYKSQGVMSASPGAPWRIFFRSIREPPALVPFSLAKMETSSPTGNANSSRSTPRAAGSSMIPSTS